uniref:TLDc domain-containing protein n=1 Tax=Caenorhabditis tropicalis TaxID=1561998 RepID=A0A1I7TPU1_9PELO
MIELHSSTSKMFQHVLPSAEKAYHAIYHELDSKASGSGSTPMFGQLYVALIEDQFTFGGDMDEWPNSVFENNDRGCKPFMAANVHHLCADSYFLVHQDMVK